MGDIFSDYLICSYHISSYTPTGPNVGLVSYKFSVFHYKADFSMQTIGCSFLHLFVGFR